MLDVIERNARAQAQLIEDLLDMARIITGKLRLEPKPLQLVAVIEAAIESVRPAADAKGIASGARARSGRVPTIGGDRNRLQQVFWNLLSNAVKFTPPRRTRTGDRASRGRTSGLRVIDTGAGHRTRVPAVTCSIVFARRIRA